MKQITIIKRLPRGVRFVQLPSDFKVDISIANDVVFVEFLDWKTSESLFFSFFFIDDDWHKSFDDFSEKGQELLLERLKDAIVNDISIFVSGKYEGVSEPEEPYYSFNGCLDIDTYIENWEAYYDLISDDEDILMFTSVKAFGTGGKRKKIFQDIYFSVEDVDGIGVLYTKTGEYSAILKIENPVQKYSANIDNYYEFTNLLTALAQTLGEGYAIHKQDVFIKKQFHDETNDNHEFLSESYFRYFTGRTYTDVQTYLIITQENKKSHLFSFDSKKWRDFLVKIRKVKDQLKDSGVDSAYLDGATARKRWTMNVSAWAINAARFTALSMWTASISQVSSVLTPTLRSTIPRCRLTLCLSWTTYLWLRQSSTIR